jgi:hypothetical protein
MNPNETRMTTTLIIWVAFAAILIFAHGPITENTFNIALLMIGTFVSTLAIWSNRGETHGSEASIEKAKRRAVGEATPVERLVNLLEEDELEELKERLAMEEERQRR